eukprot:365803-Chlamydomonas_euryale.AAC.2
MRSYMPYLHIHPSIYLPIRLSVHPRQFCVHVRPSVLPSVLPSQHHRTCPSIRLRFNWSACTYHHPTTAPASALSPCRSPVRPPHLDALTCRRMHAWAARSPGSSQKRRGALQAGQGTRRNTLIQAC